MKDLPDLNPKKLLEGEPLQPSLTLPSLTLTAADRDEQVIQMWLSEKSELTQMTYVGSLQQFFALVNKPLAAITVDDLILFKQWCIEQFKVSTVNKKLACLKSLLSFANGIGYLQFNAGKVIKPAKLSNEQEKKSLNVNQRIISPQEIRTLVNGAQSERDRLIIRVLYKLGLRVSELCNLRWEDITAHPSKPQTYLISIIGKGAKLRINEMTQDFHRQLKALGTEDFVFVSRNHRPLTRQMIHKIIKGCALRAGIDPKLSTHWLRHSHASHSLANGAPLKSVQEQLGHSSIAITGIYLHTDESSSSYLDI